MTDRAEEGERGRHTADPLRGDGDSAGAKRRSTELDAGDESGKKQKISSSLDSKKASSISAPTSKKKAPIAGITMKLSNTKPKEPDIKPSKKFALSDVFGEDSEEEEEEMPPEAKMRMKNLGRITATSSGPNSFHKGKEGFTNHQGRAWRLKKEEEIAKAEHEKRLRELKELEGKPI